MCIVQVFILVLIQLRSADAVSISVLKDQSSPIPVTRMIFNGDCSHPPNSTEYHYQLIDSEWSRLSSGDLFMFAQLKLYSVPQPPKIKSVIIGFWSNSDPRPCSIQTCYAVMNCTLVLHSIQVTNYIYQPPTRCYILLPSSTTSIRPNTMVISIIGTDDKNTTLSSGWSTTNILEYKGIE